MPKGNRIGPRSCNTRRAIFGGVGACATSTNMSVPTGWWAVFPIVEVSAYGLSSVALFRSRMKARGPCCTSAIGVAYLVAGGMIGVVGGVRIPPSYGVLK